MVKAPVTGSLRVWQPCGDDDERGMQSTQESDSNTWMMRSALQSNGGCLWLAWQQQHSERRHTVKGTLHNSGMMQNKKSFLTQ